MLSSKFKKRTPLLMYPNGTFARSKVIVDGCVVVEEPKFKVSKQEVIDQTAAVKEGEK